VAFQDGTYAEAVEVVDIYCNNLEEVGAFRLAWDLLPLVASASASYVVEGPDLFYHDIAVEVGHFEKLEVP